MLARASRGCNLFVGAVLAGRHDYGLEALYSAGQKRVALQGKSGLTFASWSNCGEGSLG